VNDIFYKRRKHSLTIFGAFTMYDEPISQLEMTTLTLQTATSSLMSLVPRDSCMWMETTQTSLSS